MQNNGSWMSRKKRITEVRDDLEPMKSGTDREAGRASQSADALLQRFHYLANLAMSGDMKAMYEFMQFITRIISEQKALQNVEMASKLEDLEESSRNALQELLDAPTPDEEEKKPDYTRRITAIKRKLKPLFELLSLEK